MSRHSFNSKLYPYTDHVTGNDHAIGKFIDITDRRYAGCPDDEQGEGYILEWSQLFGFTTNLIGATPEDLLSFDALQAKVEAFASNLKPFKFKYKLQSFADDTDLYAVSEEEFDDYNSALKTGEEAKNNIPSGYKNNYWVNVFSVYTK